MVFSFGLFAKLSGTRATEVAYGVVPAAPAIRSKIDFRLKLCLPTAPVLPMSERRIRHVSVLWQLSGKRVLASEMIMGVPASKHNGTLKI